MDHFIPSGWNILDSATGDLNGDELLDAVVVLQFEDSVEILKTEGETVLTQPRILIILFRSVSENNFYLKEQSNSFVLNHDNSAMDDPFRDISISKRVLTIRFQLFYSAGSWHTTNSAYKFRYEGNQFVLIGADKYSIHRASHDYEDYSYNFLTKKLIVTNGNDTRGPKKQSLKHINIQKLKTIKTLKSPFTWEIRPNFYL